MTTAALLALRRAATMAHRFRCVRLRLRYPDAPSVEVGPTVRAGSSRVVDPCSFRRAVIDAHAAATRRGDPMTLLGTLASSDPAVDIAVVGERGRIRPSGLYLLPIGDALVGAFPTHLSPAHCRRLMAVPNAVTGTHPSCADRVVVQRDVATEITVIQGLVSPRPDGADALEALALRVAAEEIAEAISPTGLVK